jgi:DNA-nicking Smr family endonuclease
MPRARKKPGPPRRATSNRYAAATAAQRELDFHELGVLDGQTVRRLTEDFLADARRCSLRRVRLITGKGLHSRGRPLVKPQVLRVLREMERIGLIDGFEVEKVSAGGDGAFHVRL